MDLIFTDKNRTEQGILRSFTLDVAFGNDENDFVLTVPIKDHCCTSGCYAYISGTEYGGIIDSVKTDSVNKTVEYKGRTWHGILASHIIEPPTGNDYRYLSGDANAVIRTILSLCGVDFFVGSSVQSGITIRNYQVPRYIDAYSLIRKILGTVNARLKVEMNGKNVVFSAVMSVDYSSLSWLDSNAVGLKAERKGNPINHVICLGSGNLADRKVIHLFTDSKGKIQPYKTEETPISDDDYITDKSNMILLGNDEVACVYDYPNAEIKSNYEIVTDYPPDWETDAIKTYFASTEDGYKPLESWIADDYILTEMQPYGWDKTYSDYYVKNGNAYEKVTYEEASYSLLTSQPADWYTSYLSLYVLKNGKYVSVASSIKDCSYKLLTSKPINWGRDYGFYYTYDSTKDKYLSVESEETESTEYVEQTIVPDDWAENYANYYYYTNDGLTEEYKRIQADKEDTYTVTTQQPTNWKSVYKNYYEQMRCEVYNFHYIRQTYHETDATKYEYLEQTWSDTSRSWSEEVVTSTTQMEEVTDRKFIRKLLRVIKYMQGTWDSQDVYSSTELNPYSTDTEKLVYIGRDIVQAFTTMEKLNSATAPIWKPNTYYIKGQKNVAPDFNDLSYVYGVYAFVTNVTSSAPEWVANTFYEYSTDFEIPAFQTNTFYRYISGHNPTWCIGRYYKLNKDVVHYPTFVSGKYYREVLDHFCELVLGGIEILETAWQTESVEMSINNDSMDYAVGDIIGAEEHSLGMEIKQRIAKKIVKFSDGRVSYSYETEEK